MAGKNNLIAALAPHLINAAISAGAGFFASRAAKPPRRTRRRRRCCCQIGGKDTRQKPVRLTPQTLAPSPPRIAL